MKNLLKNKLIVLFLFISIPVPAFILADKLAYHLEKKNSFCIACHLHESKFKQFNAKTDNIDSLAGRHHLAENEVICIDCHKGEGIKERAMVLAIASIDTVKYFLGSPKEPTAMKYPLSDITCLKCHQNDIIPVGSYSEDYHQLPAHTILGIACYKCHIVHIKGDKSIRFMQTDQLVPVCKECHPGKF